VYPITETLSPRTERSAHLDSERPVGACSSQEDYLSALKQEERLWAIADTSVGSIERRDIERAVARRSTRAPPKQGTRTEKDRENSKRQLKKKGRRIRIGARQSKTRADDRGSITKLALFLSPDSTREERPRGESDSV